ncbi:hypothetical protein, partial [Gallibacterium anatis]|uniref:hypothetical protein n=1 Tax=Gallibacterium anatis TaxID=750 RepID=UPI001E4594F5
MAALALGTESVARKSYTIAQGYQAKAWEEGAIAIGQQAKANARNAIVLGNSSSNQSQNAVVIGNNINLNGSYNDSVVIGNNSTVATNGETRGTSSYTSETIGGLTYGGFTGNPTSVFSIGPSTGRTLQHVAAGKLSATSMDAVNGSQLYRTNLALGNLAKTLVDNLGDNAAVVKTNGDTLGQLSFSNIGGTQKNTVHEAIKTIAESTIKLEGNNGSTTDEKNRKTNSSFGIKGASGGGITTTASGSDVSISLDKTTKDTLAKVDQMETKVTQLSSGKADTELSNLTNAGKSVITGLVDVKSSSTALTVSSQTDQTSQKKTFNLALNEDGIKELAGTKTLANDISTAKTEAIKDAKSYTDGKLGNTSLTAVNGNNNTAPTTITQAISQITNAVNSGWEIQQGSTKKGDIGAGKKVNFANGDLTTASVVMSADNNTATVKFNVQTTDLDNDKTTGAVSVTEENKNKLVSAENIANAINKATSSLSSSLAFRGDNNPTVGVDVADDTNTKVDLKKQALKVLGTKGQIKTNATSDGLTISLDSTITDTLTNLENSLGNTSLTTTINGNNAAPSSISEAVNQLTTAVNAGWKLKENGNEKGGVGATEAVDFVNGNNTTATVTAKTANKPATVSFSVNTATLTNDNTTGKITTPTTDDANKLVTAGNLATVVNNAVDPNKLATNVKLSYTSTNGTTAATPAKQVSLSDGLNFKSLNNNLTITAKDDGVVEFQAKDWTSDITTAKEVAVTEAKTYTDTQISGLSSSLKFTGDTNVPENLKDPNAPSVDLKNQALAVNGTSGYVTTKAEGQTLTIDLNKTLKEKLDNLPTNVKESLQTINNKIGTAPADALNAQTSPAGADGLNGKSLTEQINALRDGTAGNVVYTNQDGKRLVKGSDGKYYPAEQVGNKVQGTDGKWYPEGTTFKDGNPIKDGSQVAALADADTPKEVAKDSIVSTAVNPDGSTEKPIQMGNVKSGLGLDGTGKDGSGSVSDPKAITVKAAKNAIAGADGQSGLLAMEGANSLNKVATVGDLQALAQAGIDFLGNGGDAIHKPLGSTLKIEGKSDTTYDDSNKAHYSADNLITHSDGDTLRIEMLKKPNFEGVQLGSADGEKITLTPNADNGKLTLAKTKADGSALDNPADNKVVLDGLKAGDTADSAVTKGQLDELASQIGTPVPEDTTGTAGADG